MKAKYLLAMAVFSALASAPARAQDATVATKSLTPEIALDAAKAALNDCRKRGYQVSVAVVDRSGTPQVMLRDRFAGAHTPPTATGKAWTAVSFKSSTNDLVAATQAPAMQGLRQLPNVVLIGGGVVIEAGGTMLGGIGVSGAPGGDADEACAKAGIAAISDKLDF
ncbi:MAG: GlcG/HbpS family heme-binding protein [Afipia sp.]